MGVLGLICFGTGPVLGVTAILLGLAGRHQIRSSGGEMAGRGMALAGIVAGLLSIFCFAAALTVYLTFLRPRQTPTASLLSAAQATTATKEGASAQGAAQTDSARPVEKDDPVPTTSTVMTIGALTVVDVAAGVSSLAKELRDQRQAAASHGEKLLLQTTASSCSSCQNVAAALGDPRMQRALDHVRLVRVDRDQFQEDLEELDIPLTPYPGFFLIDSDLKISDAINVGEWDDDVAKNIAPVLGPFVRGTYAKRRTPWRKTPRPSGTVM